MFVGDELKEQGLRTLQLFGAGVERPDRRLDQTIVERGFNRWRVGGSCIGAISTRNEVEGEMINDYSVEHL